MSVEERQGVLDSRCYFDSVLTGVPGGVVYRGDLVTDHIWRTNGSLRRDISVHSHASLWVLGLCLFAFATGRHGVFVTMRRVWVERGFWDETSAIRLRLWAGRFSCSRARFGQTDFAFASFTLFASLDGTFSLFGIAFCRSKKSGFFRLV